MPGFWLKQAGEPSLYERPLWVESSPNLGAKLLQRWLTAAHCIAPCLLDREPILEPILQAMTDCDRYEKREDG